MTEHTLVKFVRLFHRQSFTLYGNLKQQHIYTLHQKINYSDIASSPCNMFNGFSYSVNTINDNVLDDNVVPEGHSYMVSQKQTD